jgi:hypothetical protein
MTSQVSFKGMHVKLVILASLAGGIVESNLSRIPPNPLSVQVRILLLYGVTSINYVLYALFLIINKRYRM